MIATLKDLVGAGLTEREVVGVLLRRRAKVPLRQRIREAQKQGHVTVETMNEMFEQLDMMNAMGLPDERITTFIHDEPGNMLRAV